MKKKIATIALVSLLAISTVFAGGLFKKPAKSGPEISVGLTTGFDQEIMNTEHTSTSFNAVPVKVTGIIGITDNFAVGANLGMGINLAADEYLDKTRVGFAADVLAYYVLPATDSLNIYIGGGFGYDYINYINEKNLKHSMHTLDIVIDAKTAFEVTDHVEIMGGVNLGFDVLKSLTHKVANTRLDSTNALENTFGMQWGINVGAAYKF